MPLLTAQKHQWTKQPPYNFYHFPEEHRVAWQSFWKSMGGDIDKVLDFAKKADIESPNEWCEALHLFLFSIFVGNPKLLKNAAEKSFGGFLGQVAKNHQNDPREKAWYTIRGITANHFIAMLERAADIADVRQSVAHINSRVVDLGFSLYSEYMLSKTKEKSDIKSVASDMNKKAYMLECEALEEPPVTGITPHTVIGHSLYPDEQFTVTKVINDDDGNINMIIACNAEGHKTFIQDLWNVCAA